MKEILVTVRRSKVRPNKNGSILLTLPIVWAEENDLSPGDILRVCRPVGKEDTLVIIAEKGESVPV